jgi:hypothetical protein
MLHARRRNELVKTAIRFELASARVRLPQAFREPSLLAFRESALEKRDDSTLKPSIRLFHR